MVRPSTSITAGSHRPAPTSSQSDCFEQRTGFPAHGSAPVPESAGLHAVSKCESLRPHASPVFPPSVPIAQHTESGAQLLRLTHEMYASGPLMHSAGPLPIG